MTAPAAPVNFCTEHSLAAGEPLAGWGTHPARNVLVRWPKAKWRHSLRIAADMAPATQAAIEGLAGRDWRINLIDRKSEASETLCAYLLPQALRFDLHPDALVAFLAAVPKGPEALRAFAPQPMTAPLVLVCTHGRHDRCCAKWGFQTYRAVAAEAARRGGFDVWECTHLGGCRFATGALVLPAGRKYGRLMPDDAAPFLAAEAERRPYLPCYRGAAHLSPPEQVAEVTALAALPPGPVTVTPAGSDGTAHLFHVSTPIARCTIRCTPEQLRSYGACEDLHARAALEPKTVWRGKILPPGIQEIITCD
ncbi:MAG: sucrase ferredoxin [Pseudomonadota bacterium]